MLAAVLSFLTGGITKYLVVGLALSILLGWLFWARASLKTDLANAQTELVAVQLAYDANRLALQQIEEAMNTQALALAQREAAIKEISSQREAMRQSWQEAMRDDQEACDWGLGPLPGAVRQLLQ